MLAAAAVRRCTRINYGKEAKMSFKKLAIMLAAVMALGAVFAGNAFAGEAVTDPAEWVEETSPGVVTGISHSAITCGRTEGATPFVLKSKVLTQEVELTATGISCAGAEIKTTGSATA